MRAAHRGRLLIPSGSIGDRSIIHNRRPAAGIVDKSIPEPHDGPLGLGWSEAEFGQRRVAGTVIRLQPLEGLAEITGRRRDACENV